MNDIETLVHFSNKYGASSDYVIAGGGNTSCKDDAYLYVKGSGTALGTIQADGFVKMNRSGLDAIMTKSYSENEKERESQVLADMMAACAPGEKRRPSVEAMLHNLFPQKFVLHLHPAIVNGITCANAYTDTIGRLFPDALVTYGSKPGYVLAAMCARELNAYKALKGRDCDMLFLQNHGVFFAANSEEGLDVLVGDCINKIKNEIKRFPSFSEADANAEAVVKCGAAIEKAFEGQTVRFAGGKDVLEFDPLTKSPTPDHIVYAKARMLAVNPGFDAQEILCAAGKFEKLNGYAPKVIYVNGIGAFILGTSEKDAELIRLIFLDFVKITVYAESFGGYSPMTDELIAFICNWEAESYRRKQI